MVSFQRHLPADWLENEFGFEPELHFEQYRDSPLDEYTIASEGNGGRGGAGNGDLDARRAREVYVARVPGGSPLDYTRLNYASSKRIAKEIASRLGDRLSGGKVLVKPNNTGFTGLFLKSPLREIMDASGATLDADHQPYATQPAVVAGAVDALLESGVAEVHIGENMLWNGGTPRAFFETGYSQRFSRPEYDGRVFFVDLYEGDDTPLLELPISVAGHDIGDFKTMHPPRALFDENYDLVLVTSIAKVHNCSWYTLAAKNSSITWNPRKKQGRVYPRWHAHGLPVKVFDDAYLKGLLGADFEKKFDYELLGTVELERDERGALKIQPEGGKVSGVVISNGLQSTAPIRTYPSYGGRVFQVDPHHHAGINLLTTHLGMQYLTNRSYGMFASIVKELRANGTEVAAICSGVVAQEGEGPLLYGDLRYGGFNVGGFNFTAVERACLDIMFGTDRSGFAGFATRWNEGKVRELKLGATAELVLADARDPWTLKLLSDLLGEERDLASIPVRVFDFARGDQLEDAGELHELRLGDPFRFTDSVYCSLATWLRAMYTEPAIYENFARYNKKGVTIPLIPGVVN
ncbi:MAG: DUF362 domain-containing protein [Promethearchaeota archaeon]